MRDYTIYFKKYEKEFVDDFVASAYLGFKSKGKECKFYEDIKDVPVSKYNVVIGPIDETSYYFEQLGINILNDIPPINIPASLNSEAFLGRKTYIMSMREFKDTQNVPIFAKSADVLKQFSAGVISKEKSKNDFYYDVPDDTRVLVSEVLNIESEYRVFVNRNEIIGMKNYIGNFFVYPDPKIIKIAIASYKNPPISYTIDFGVTLEGETVLIECNDGWSVGDYGLDQDIYAKFLLDRWIQITNAYV